MTAAWLFNLDAERELAAHRSGTTEAALGGAAAAQMARAIQSLSGQLDDGGLLSAGDLVVEAGPLQRPLDADKITPVAWCPTPRARAAMGALGLELAGPPVGVLVQANARETFMALDPLPGAVVARSLAEIRAAVSRSPLPRGGGGAAKRPAWVLRRSLGCAGSGRLVAEGWDGRVEAWAQASLGEGPVEIQPMVDIVDEFSVHGRVDEGGATRCGAPIRWRGPTLMPGEVAPAELSAAESTRLGSSALEVGTTLAELGYFGPFGMDAYRWRGQRGLMLQVGTDINARLTLHFGRGAPSLLLPGSGHQEHLAEG